MVEGGWDPEILITGHAGKLRREETNMADGATTLAAKYRNRSDF